MSYVTMSSFESGAECKQLTEGNRQYLQLGMKYKVLHKKGTFEAFYPCLLHSNLLYLTNVDDSVLITDVYTVCQ